MILNDSTVYDFTTSCLFLQMFIRVKDSNRTDNYAETTLFITVIRNPSAPRFTNPDFPTPQTQTLELTVLETVGIGKLVFHLNATDDDGVSCLD